MFDEAILELEIDWRRVCFAQAKHESLASGGEGNLITESKLAGGV